MLFQVVQQTVEHHMVMRSPFAEDVRKAGNLYPKRCCLFLPGSGKERMLVKSASPP